MAHLGRPHPRHSLSRVSLLAPTLALALLGCRTPSSKIPIDQLEGSSQTDEARGGEAHERLEPLPVEAAADLLPADVAAMGEAIDPAAVLGHITKLDKFNEFQMLRGQMRSEIGVDLLDPGQWERVGLDRHRPVGAGLLDIEAQAMFAYAGVTDANALEVFIESLADRVGMREQLASAEIDRARVFRFGDELSVIVREGIVVVVYCDRPDRATRDYAAMVATIDPREALGRTQAFTWAKQQLETADDGMIFVEPQRLLAQIRKDPFDDGMDYGVRYAEDELAAARRRGDGRDVIDELERRVEEERKWLEERELRQTAERELVDALFGPIGALVAAAELRDDGISGHARLLIPGDGLLARLFVPIEAESPLLRALDEPPLMAVDGRIDVPSALMLAELMAKAEGESLQSINGEARSQLGVDLLGEVVPAFTGAGGLWITQRREVDPKQLGEVQKSLGLAVHAELAKPEVIRRLFDALLQSKRVSELARAKRGDGWVLTVPKWNEVHVSVVGNRLIASTDAKLGERVRDAKPGAQAKALAEPSHLLRGPSPTPSIQMYQRWRWLLIADTREPWTQDPESMLYDLNVHHELSPDEAAAVPRSREFKRKFAEFSKAVAALDELQRREAVRNLELQLQMVDGLGDFGMQIERVSDGVGARAVWRMSPGVTLMDPIMQLFMFGSGMDWTEYERLSQDIARAQEELMRVRRADLDAAAAKREPATGKP